MNQSVRTGSQLPYPEFRRRHETERPSPVVWQWKTLAEELGAAEHTEYGTITLSTPDGGHEIVPGTAMTFQVVKPGDRTTPHSHSWWHVYFVRSGAGSVVFDGSDEAAELNTGDIMHIPAWAVHHFENRGVEEDLVLLNMSNYPQQSGLGNLLSKGNQVADRTG